jgi:hypothetical protein
MKRTTKFTHKGVQCSVDTSQVRINLDKESTQWLMKMLADHGCDEHDIKSLLDPKSDMDMAKALLKVLLEDLYAAKEKALECIGYQTFPF